MALQTPLGVFHTEHAKRLVDFHGWRMPLYFSSILAEHHAVRRDVAVFDVSHMGDLLLTGAAGAEALEGAIPSSLPSVNQARYTHLLRRDGTILDDVMIVGLDRHQYLCVCNAGRTTEVTRWFARFVGSAEVRDLTSDLVCLAVQGPRAVEALENLLEEALSGLRRFQGLVARLRAMEASAVSPREMEGWVPLHARLGVGTSGERSELYVTRTGYTGEDGFEVYADSGLGLALWRALVDAQVTPAGLGARDTLRMEKGYLLSGQDFDGRRTPLEAGYEWLIAWDHDFVGREPLLQLKQRGSYPRFVGVQLLDRGVPRAGASVLRRGEVVGSLTSGTLSPTLGVGMGLGYVEKDASAPGTAVEVEIRGRQHEAETIRLPFV